jgi:hypothetical protein
MAEIKKIIIPKPLKELLNKEAGFTIEEIVSSMEIEENKKFIKEIEPLIKEVLKKEFPMLSMFL